jgi:hypothetical protein
MADKWVPYEFDFYVGDKKNGRRPDITNMMPCLAFRRELKDLILPLQDDYLELLPIKASGEDWLILNCLRTTNCYDEGESILHRDPTGQIFMVQKLRITNQSIGDAELFTVDGSNRSYTYLLQPMVDRILGLHLEGLTFRAIGEAT